jgi:hypothetical protein
MERKSVVEAHQRQQAFVCGEFQRPMICDQESLDVLGMRAMSDEEPALVPAAWVPFSDPFLSKSAADQRC